MIRACSTDCRFATGKPRASGDDPGCEVTINVTGG